MCALLLGGVCASFSAGCAGPEGGVDPAEQTGHSRLFYPELYWLYDPSCVSPRPDDERRVQDALALWTDYWPVSIEIEQPAASRPGQRATPPDAPIVAVCLMDEWPDAEHSGLSYGPDLVTMRARIEAWRGVDRRRYMTGLIAHELGHVILNSPGKHLSDHLPDELEGIMNSTVDCEGGVEDCLWSSSDIEHLEAFGLTYERATEAAARVSRF